MDYTEAVEHFEKMCEHYNLPTPEFRMANTRYDYAGAGEVGFSWDGHGRTADSVKYLFGEYTAALCVTDEGVRITVARMMGSLLVAQGG